jgi:hypothetical protein
MAGFIPAIHVFLVRRDCKDVDARHKAGHDESEHRILFQINRNCARSRFASFGIACPTMMSLKCRVCW